MLELRKDIGLLGQEELAGARRCARTVQHYLFRRNEREVWLDSI